MLIDLAQNKLLQLLFLPKMIFARSVMLASMETGSYNFGVYRESFTFQFFGTERRMFFKTCGFCAHFK